MKETIHAAILGASGYGAAELLRLCTQHRHIKIVTATSTSVVGERIADVHPHLAGFYDDLIIRESLDLEELLETPKAVLFSALPHGVSGSTIDTLLSQNSQDQRLERLRVVDLSGDLRLKDAESHHRFYPKSGALSERRREFAYGMPELFRGSIGASRYIANPGCLASASILSVAPLSLLAIEGAVVIDAKTGSSGSGRKLKSGTHHPTRHSNFRAYKALAHQHEPEIKQALAELGGQQLETSFVAQSMDTTRGIFVTAHLTLKEETHTIALEELYSTFYKSSPFVRVVTGSPELQNVVGSNFCDVAVTCRGRQVIAMAALDNLIKGMAGAALQNTNIICGLPETTGLWAPSMRPV